MSEKSYQVLRQEGSFCVGGHPSFIRYKGKVYVLEFEGHESASGEKILLDAVWLGTGNNLNEKCTFNIPK